MTAHRARLGVRRTATPLPEVGPTVFGARLGVRRTVTSLPEVGP